MALLAEKKFFADIAPLVAMWEDDPEMLANCVLAASCAEVLDTLHSSILADDILDDDELAIAFDILSSVSYRYTWIDAYSRFEPLTGGDEVLEFIEQWEEDDGILGGHFSEGAIFRPFAQLVMIASIINQDVSLYNRFAQITLVISKLVIAVGGIDASEKQFMAESKSEMDAYQQFVISAIEIAQAHDVTEETFTQSAATDNICKSDEDSIAGPMQKESRDSALTKALGELNSLIGLPAVKTEVDRLANFLRVRKQRVNAGLPVHGQSLHFVFTGNPGTGKTTVARIVGRLLYGYEVLSSPKVVETDRGGLCGAWLGQTAIKTQEVIESAVDGVLFVDEAYALSQSDFDHDYGKEAIDTLLKQMEDKRDTLVVIAAGYPEEMARFLKANPGLESRFTRFIHFDDYHVSEMCRIFEGMCEINSYTLTPEARGTLAISLNHAYATKGANFGNARYVRNLFETTLGNHADRLATTDKELDRTMLSTIEAADIPNTGTHGIPLKLSDSKWKGECPHCHKVASGTLDVLGMRVQCKCGAAFMFPWWNLSSSTVVGLKGFKEFRRSEDLIGVAVE